LRVFDQSLVEVVGDLLARKTNEIDAVDALIDLLAIEHAPLQFLDPDSQQFLITLLDLEPASLVAGQSLLFGLVVILFVERAAAPRPARGGFFLRPRHGFTY
jgi:hypothetical protein